MARLALCAVMGFLWERERISDEEALRCLRESEYRRGVKLTESLNIVNVNKKNRKSDTLEARKRKSHVIRATPVASRLPASWYSLLVRQRRARQQLNTSPVTTTHNVSLHESSLSHNKLTTPQHTLHSTTTANSKLEDNNVPDTVSWWSALIGYTLGAMYNSYNEVMNYFMSSNNSNNDCVSEEDCDPNSILSTDPVLLARKCMNRGNDDKVTLFPVFSKASLHNEVANIIAKLVDTMKCYTGSPVSISLFEDALIAGDYDGTATLLPVGTMQWSPQQYSPQQYSSTTASISCDNKVIDDNLHDWQLIHHSNNTSLYARPYRDTELSQYRVVSRFDDITAVDFVEVQSNPLLRQRWDGYTGKMKVVDKDAVSNSEVLYWEVKFPFPLSNRDYVFTRRCVVLPHSIVTLSRSTQHPSAPPSRGCVRVDTYNSVMVVTADTSVHKDGFSFELIYVDDPKCNLPSSLTSWASSSGMVDFLAKVHTAALKRKELKL